MSTKIMKMQMDKFPYLSNLKESIGNLKTVIELYQKRKKLIGENKDSLSEYEKNEIEIKIWLTNKDLASAFKDLNDRETKLKINDRFAEPNRKFDKMEFIKAAMKYKILQNWKDINDWLKSTYTNIIVK